MVRVQDDRRRIINRSAVGDRTGRYMVCGIPAGAPLSVVFPAQQPLPTRLPASGYLRIDQDIQ
jgi:hypothetical protein